MAEKASDGLPYGQFGQAVYDPDDGAWHFGRLPRDEDSLQRIGEAEVVISPSASQPLSLPDGDPAGPSRRREKQTKALIRQVPELQPAADLLPELARVSEAVENATARHDPSRGHLLARGEIYDEVAKKPVPAIAFPCGCNGGDMRIIRTAKQRQGWTDDKDSWIEVPTMSDYEVTWRGPGVPISSVVFAHPYEKGPSYLAVRLQVETLIFRPVARKLDSTGRSRMEVNFLLFISIDDTGGRPHADISFNSWVNGEFAIVDDAGSFSVWEVPGRDSHRANMINEGRNIITDRDSAKIPDDGWARVTWVADAETLCVCTRHELLLVPGNGQHDRASVRRVDIDAKLRGGIGWIVDIACVWNSPRLLFVLTSSHILVVGVDRSIDNETGWKMAASVRHHRNPDDLTLIMHLLSTEDGKSNHC